jgi:hypothetical protein
MGLVAHLSQGGLHAHHPFDTRGLHAHHPFATRMYLRLASTPMTVSGDFRYISDYCNFHHRHDGLGECKPAKRNVASDSLRCRMTYKILASRKVVQNNLSCATSDGRSRSKSYFNIQLVHASTSHYDYTTSSNYFLFVL